MQTQLETILAHTQAEVAERRKSADLRLLEQRAAAHQPRGFERALRQVSESGPAVIAELKKASPSRGLIRAEFDPPRLARSLEAAGAAALSVLTDREYFHGSLRYLEQASSAVKIPCLRKDFMLDEFQMLEARASCADAVLLIVAALSDVRLTSLRDEAIRSELDVLCEVHDSEELKRAVDLGFTIIGVNSRNLHTMQVQPETQLELGARLPQSAVRVAESGLRTPADISRMSAAGYTAFLIGESLMRQPDPAQALAVLLKPEPAAALR
jgi:indole-3-glycerol phosphate synthase